MDKIKITKKENEAVSLAIEECGISLGDFISTQNKGGYSIYDDLSQLNDFTPEQFALLLCGWYEVKETFREGDWVVHKDSGKVGEVVVNPFGGFDVKAYREGFSLHSHDFHKATPEEIAQEKERRKWAKIGREVGEYKMGDIVRHKSFNHLCEVTKDSQCTIVYATPDFANTEKMFDAHWLTLVTPVEQRLDIKGDE